MHLLHDALPLLLFKVLFLDLEGPVEQLQLGRVGLQMHL